MGRYSWLCLIAGLLVSSVAGAQESKEEPMLTGAELLENCRPGTGEQAPTAYCMEFVSGLVQTLSTLQELAPEGERIFCIDPNEMDLEAVTRRVTAWLQAHPARLREPAFLLVSEALGDNYPCADNNRETA